MIPTTVLMTSCTVGWPMTTGPTHVPSMVSVRYRVSQSLIYGIRLERGGEHMILNGRTKSCIYWLIKKIYGCMLHQTIAYILAL